MSPPAWRKDDSRKDERDEYLKEGAEGAKYCRDKYDEAKAKQDKDKKGGKK